MKHKLKDGRIVEVVPLSPKIPVKWFQKYINTFVEEDSFLLHDRKFSYKEENEWLQNAIRSVQKKQMIYLAALYGKRVVGTCNAVKGIGRESGNVIIGIAVTKDFRRAGLGRFLLEKTIFETKKRMKPHNVYLNVAAPNKPAKALYEKLGFKEMARFPKWIKRKGKYHDVIWMLLKKEEK